MPIIGILSIKQWLGAKLAAAMAHREEANALVAGRKEKVRKGRIL